MKNFFSIDGKFFAVMSKVADLLFVALLWIVGCLPVVTVMTSTASMYYVVVKCIRFDCGRVWPEFWEAYRNNLRQGIGLTLLFGGIGAAIGFLDYQIFVLSTSRSGAFFILSICALMISLVYILNALWIAPVFSRFSNSFGKLLMLNYVIAMKNLVRSIPMLLLTVVAIIVILAIREMVFIFPSLVLLIHSFLVEPALRRYMPKQEEDNGDWRYEFR